MSKCGRVRSRWPADRHLQSGKTLLQIWTPDLPSTPIAMSCGTPLFESALQEERRDDTKCVDFFFKITEYSLNLSKNVTYHMCCRSVVFVFSMQLRFIETWNHPQISHNTSSFHLFGNIFTLLGISHFWWALFMLTDLLLSCIKLCLRCSLQWNERNTEKSQYHITQTLFSSGLSSTSSLGTWVKEYILSHYTSDHRFLNVRAELKYSDSSNGGKVKCELIIKLCSSELTFQPRFPRSHLTPLSPPLYAKLREITPFNLLQLSPH